MKSIYLVFVSLILTSIMMQPNIATLIAQTFNACVLMALWALSRVEGSRR